MTRAEEKGWPTSQNALADKLGRSQGSVQAWVRGTSLPAMKGAVEIAGKLGLCVEYLLTGQGPQKVTAEDPELLELTEIWSELVPERQAALLRFAHFERAEQARQPPADFQKSPSLRATSGIQDRPARYRARK